MDIVEIFRQKNDDDAENLIKSSYIRKRVWPWLVVYARNAAPIPVSVRLVFISSGGVAVYGVRFVYDQN